MDGITSYAQGQLHEVLQKLSFSPFRSFVGMTNDIPYLGYVNYFIPISTFVAILEAWTAAIGVYYLCSIVLRWIKAIQ